MNDEIRRNMPLFPIGIVMELTQLSARQIRYYEQHGLIHPSRTEGKHRIFSFNDIDILLEIKSLIEKGVNIAGIKKQFAMKAQQLNQHICNSNKQVISQEQLRNRLRSELLQQIGRSGKTSLIQGELSRFFH
ncbi:MerR family transcriptional regulator [Massilibacterium senegalense]|uniref:MerR family transcriptional regulator n=1 Tax=Massilibacterium senegalense TaxID=1632858 RepID=UPI000782FE72|nr:MerR family transcriptional regulator [Massilibacterium senegalense]